MPFDRLLCPTCLVDDFDPLTTPSAHFHAARCRRCGLGVERHLAVDPVLYDPIDYAATRDGGADKNPFHRWHHDLAVAHDRVDQVRELVPRPVAGVWVDVGCNLGAQLAALRRTGWSARGIESTDRACRLAESVTGCPVQTYREWILEPYPRAAVVSVYDVLEHLVDPTLVLAHAARILRDVPGGCLVVEVPDLATCDPGAAFERWKHRRISQRATEHVWHFDAAALAAMAARYAPSLTVVQTLAPVPGKLRTVWRNGGPT